MLCKRCDTSLGHVSQGLHPAKSCRGCRPLAQVYDSSRACLSDAITRPAFSRKFRCSQNWWRLLPLEPAKFTRVVVGSSEAPRGFADRAENLHFQSEVFDTETSGFSNDDEILEIGAIELEAWVKVSTSLKMGYMIL